MKNWRPILRDIALVTGLIATVLLIRSFYQEKTDHKECGCNE